MSVSVQSKFAPRLLHDFTAYNPLGTYGEIFIVDAERNFCQHTFIKNNDRSVLPDYSTTQLGGEQKWSIALTCQNCRIHLDVAIDLSGARTPCPSANAALHHFQHIPEADLVDDGAPRHYRFRCLNTACHGQLWATFRPPIISQKDVAFLTSDAKTRLRATPDLIQTKIGEKDPVQVFKKYVTDSLDDKPGPPKRVRTINPVFNACLGVERSELLQRLGFSFERGTPEDGVNTDEWIAPQPQPHNKTSLYFDKTRRNLEDCREELIILSLKSASKMFPPPPSKDFERLLGCLDYDTFPSSRRSHVSPSIEDELAYRCLGCLADFSDKLIDWCYDRQKLANPEEAPMYYGCLKIVARSRNSEQLSLKAMTLASQGEMTLGELATAYQVIGIDQSHVKSINDDHILSAYQARFPDAGQTEKQHMRAALKQIAEHRQSSLLRNASAELMDFDQALNWLGVTNETDHSTIWACKVEKDNAEPTSKALTTRAIQIIQHQTKSDILLAHMQAEGCSLLDDSNTMDSMTAYSILNIESSADDDQVQISYISMMDEHAPPETKLELARALQAIGESRKSAVLEEIASNHIREAVAKIASAVNGAEPVDISEPRGIRNLSNTCYLNSILQYLYTIKYIRGLVRDDLGELGRKDGVGRREVITKADLANPHFRDRLFVRELKIFFDSLATSRTSYVTPKVLLAALTLAPRPEENKGASIEKRRRSTIANRRTSRPSFSSNTLPAGSDSRPHLMENPSDHGNELHTVDENAVPVIGSDGGKNVPTPRDSSTISLDQMEVDAKALEESTNLLSQSHVDASAGLGIDSDQLGWGSAVNDGVGVAGITDQDFSDWTKDQQDMGEVLSNAFRQLGRAFGSKETPVPTEGNDRISGSYPHLQKRVANIK